MLNLTKVALQVKGMAQAIRDFEDGLSKKRALADQLLAGGDWARLVSRVRESKTSWLVAEPTEDLHKVYTCPPITGVFSVIATDGSQIMPDHHGPVLCYLLNLGSVVIHYGSGERPKLTSEPMVCYSESDLYWEINGKQVLVQGELLAAKRSELEARGLVNLIKETSSAGRVTVALEDGSLIKWNLEQGSEWQRQLLAGYLQTLSTARELRTPLCGYLSGSRACDVVNLLRLLLCPQDPVNCNQCLYKQCPPCQRLDGLTDTNLFSRVLKRKGERSQVFVSSSKIQDQYGEHRVGFFYLNVGSEIARVELPAWTWQDAQLLNLVQATIVDQVNKGNGYPVVLSEAHEQAVIKGPDRNAFFRLVEGAFISQGIPVRSSSKSQNKKVPRV